MDKGLITQTPAPLVSLSKVGDRYANQTDYLKNRSMIQRLRIGNIVLVVVLPLSLIFVTVMAVVIYKHNKTKKNLLGGTQLDKKDDNDKTLIGSLPDELD